MLLICFLLSKPSKRTRTRGWGSASHNDRCEKRKPTYWPAMSRTRKGQFQVWIECKSDVFSHFTRMLNRHQAWLTHLICTQSKISSISRLFCYTSYQGVRRNPRRQLSSQDPVVDSINFFPPHHHTINHIIMTRINPFKFKLSMIEGPLIDDRTVIDNSSTPRSNLKDV